MLEVEMKFPVADLGRVRAALESLGAKLHCNRHETDHYFNAPDRDFAQTDEALRLRQVGDENVLTYKGPKLDLQTKTRKEIEMPLAVGELPAEQATALLTYLGYRRTGTVEKDRAVYKLKFQEFLVEICLDQVERLGSYVELEIAAREEQGPAAKEALQELARRVELSVSERRSYLELLFQKG